MRFLVSLVLVAGLALAAGCLVPDVKLDGKACDSAHPCIDGYTCAIQIGSTQGVCISQGGDAGFGAVDGGVDGGPDAGPDAGVPANQGTLTGPLTFTTTYMADYSTVDNGQGESVTLLLADALWPSCDNASSALGHVIEIDATAAATVFPPGTYSLAPQDGGPSMHMAYTANQADGGFIFGYDSNLGDAGNGITGSVTFAVFAPDYITGSFDVNVHFVDAGASHLLGSFTANDSLCH